MVWCGRMSNSASTSHSAAGLGVERLTESDLVRFCSDILPKGAMYERFVNEARFGLSRLLPIMPSSDLENFDVLEVGAGSCLLSAYLASRRLRVTALEPLGSEFDFFTDLQTRVIDFCRRQEMPLQLIRTSAEQLELSGDFDLVFTINALEHMRDPLQSIDNMYRALKPGGTLLVHCPNYTIPFDTHFNILLATRSKLFNALLYRSRIARYPGVWNELNFIRYIDIRRHLEARKIQFKFNRSIAHDLVLRLFSDPVFARRMPAAVHTACSMLSRLGLLNRLDLIPARFQTPMEVAIKKM
jgi:SAM-dependent methyltransferase